MFSDPTPRTGRGAWRSPAGAARATTGRGRPAGRRTARSRAPGSGKTDQYLSIREILLAIKVYSNVRNASFSGEI